MLKRRTLFKNIISGIENVLTAERFIHNNSINIDKILIVSKLSRYEFEKKKSNTASDIELEKELRNRGTDYEKLLDSHNLHKRFENNVSETLRKLGVNVEVVNRYDYTEAKVNWADVVVPVGGDGTFLLAASKVKNNQKPVIGFNSDPTRSEGHLCVPKRYSTDIVRAIERLQKGSFHWLLRSRIRIKLINKEGDIIPKYLHEINANGDILKPFKNQEEDSKVLPVLALNEVFVGETISSRVSHLQMRLNGSIEQTSIKCSGVCVCTGTGSTSWHLSINRLPAQSIAELLKILDVKRSVHNENFPEEISDKYNKNLIFKPDDSRMCYTIRDLISAGVWPNPKGIKSREFLNKLEIKSNCFEARLVVDGGVSFDFNDGTIAFFEIREKDALRTVVLPD